MNLSSSAINIEDSIGGIVGTNLNTMNSGQGQAMSNAIANGQIGTNKKDNLVSPNPGQRKQNQQFSEKTKTKFTSRHNQVGN
jgi:propanediol dehydratase small subunit